MGYRFAAEYNHAQERLYTCHFYAILAGPRFVEIQKYCFLPWQRDVTTSLSIRKETCLPLVRLLRFSLNKFSVKYNYQNYWGEDKTWTRGPWPPTLDRVHGPLSYGAGSWTAFFKIMRNEQKQKKCKNKMKKTKTTTTNNARLISNI